jgi:hypothetical protein
MITENAYKQFQRRATPRRSQPRLFSYCVAEPIDSRPALRGVGLDPLEVIGLGLNDPPELEQGYTESQFAQLGRIYKKVRKDKRPFADEFIRMLIQTMERWR